MRRFVQATIVITALLLSPDIFAADDAYRVILTAGTVTYRNAELKEWTAVKDGLFLHDDAIIKTGDRSRAVLEKDGRRITIAENRIVPLKEMSQSGKFRASDGLSNLRTRLGDILTGKKYVSSTTIVAVRGEKMDDSSSPVWADDLTGEEKSSSEKPLDKAKDLFIKMDYKGTVALLEPAVKNMTGSEKDDGTYMLFISYYNLGSYAKCVELSDHLMIDHEASPHKRSAVILITALAHNNTGAYRDSIGLLSRFIFEFPDDPLVPEACSMLAGSYMLSGDEERAMKYYRLILDRYPASSVARDAAAMVGKKKD
ncbi:MAG: hypothetical protein CVV44_22650 [Spirochaetae bacterium HGW-Spirochaetae-1]|jgi:tetratricopeptide (TPR) repeat protein|nr:MAG: hypothetical protein CVV44_22650 [Spirochaetae bacterium HGW-Spirochaetae-1]